MSKLPKWKQNNPVDQLTVIRASLQGHRFNAVTGTINNERFLEYAKEHLKQIEQLEPFLKNPEKWYMGRPMFGDTPMPEVTYRGKTYFWNRFFCFFVSPAHYNKKKTKIVKERVIKEGELFDKLRQLSAKLSPT